MRVVLSFLLLTCVLGVAVGGESKLDLPKIAVLRLDEAFRNSKFYTTRLEVLKKSQAEAQAALKQIEDQLQQLDNQLQVINPGNERFGKLQEDFETLKLKRKLTAEREHASLDRRHGQLLKECFDRLRGELKSFCQEKGIMLVSLAPNPEIQAPNAQDVQMQLGLQSALYYDPSLDITDAFIAYTNGHFAAEQATAPASVPALPPEGKGAAPGGQTGK